MGKSIIYAKQGIKATRKERGFLPTAKAEGFHLVNSMTLKGYARVSKEDQSLDSQIDALKAARCAEGDIYTDRVSGVYKDKPGLDLCLKTLEPGDTLIVYRLDRLGRNTQSLIQMVDSLKKRGVGFRSLCEGVIDTTSATGELVFAIFAALAAFERRLLIERTKAGLEAARLRGRKPGRKALGPDDPKVKAVKRMYPELTIPEIAATLGIARPTVYKYLRVGNQ